MTADVVLLPSHLSPHQLQDQTVVVLDVLRATSTIAAALSAGVRQILIFDDLESARKAAAGHAGAKQLCGERNCLPPEGFDLGNSPQAFNASHANITLFMSTTNGTRAIAAAAGAPVILAAALVNAGAVARKAREIGRNVTLLCAGTNGELAYEDLLGAGAVIDAVRGNGELQLASDTAIMALRLFQEAKEDLEGALSSSRGGQNVIRAGLSQDIRYASQLSALDVVGQAFPAPLRVMRV